MTKRKQTCKRTIYLNDISEFDRDNVGVHFTKDLAYVHSNGGSNGVTNKNTNFRVDIYVKDYEINEEATALSNENYPKEQEVVLEFNQEINVEVRIFPRVNDCFWGRCSISTMGVNTGTRADLWVKNLNN